MSEDRAFIATFSDGGIRWVIQRADGELEWMLPDTDVIKGEQDEHREWKRLWSIRWTRILENVKAAAQG